MIYDRRCAVLVMVSGLVEGGREASALYWPDDGGLSQFGEYTVDLLGEEPLEGFKNEVELESVGPRLRHNIMHTRKHQFQD